MTQSRLPIKIGGDVKLDISDSAKKTKIGDVELQTAHLKGTRPSQEDGDLFFECNYIKSFNKKVRQQLMQQAWARADSECKELKLEGGACVAMTMSWREADKIKVCSAHAGDVSIFAVKIDEEKDTSVLRMNKTLHSVDEIAEDGALKKLLTVTQSRLGPSRLGTKEKPGPMMYRSLGDFSYRDYGLTSQVDCAENSVTLNPGEEFGLVIACDGVTECLSRMQDKGMKNYLRDLKESGEQAAFVYADKIILVEDILKVVDEKESKRDVEKHQMEEFIKLALDQSLKLVASAKPGSIESNVAWHLANWGIQLSGDNVSALWLKPGETVVCSLILDGHGGREIVDYVQANFKRIFLEEAYVLIKKNLPEAHKEKVTEVFNIVDLIVQIPSSNARPVAETKLFSGKTSDAELNTIKSLVIKFGIDSIIEKKPELFFQIIVPTLLSKWNDVRDERLNKGKKPKTDEASEKENQLLLTELMNPKTAAKIENNKLLLVIAYILQSHPAVAKNFSQKPFVDIVKFKKESKLTR